MIISRYLCKEIINTLLAVTIILLLAILSQQVVRYLSYIAVGKIPTHILLQLVSFEAPYILSFLLPLSLYLAILLTYGRLYSDNEMAILQMYGYGRRRLIRLTVWIGLIVSSLVLVLMMWVNPYISSKRQRLMSSDEATLHLVQTLIPGRFQVSPDGNHVMYVEKISRDHRRAENIFLAQGKKNQEKDVLGQNQWMLVSATEGYQVKDNQSLDNFFITENGYRYEGMPGHNDYKIIQFRKYFVRIPQNNERILHEENETFSPSQLWHDYAIAKRAGELQWRFSLAIITVILAIIAVPLSVVKPRHNRYKILIPAILIYIIYINLLYIARHWIDHGVISSAIGMWWVHVVMFMFALIVMFSFKDKKL